MNAKPQPDNTFLAVGLTLLAYGLFGLLDTSAKWLILAGISVWQVSFMRYFGHFIITLLEFIIRGKPIRPILQCNHLGYVCLRGFFLVSSSVFNFLALTYLPLSLASTILFSAPIMICALSGPLLNENVGLWRWSAVLVGFIGIVIAANPFGDDFHWAVIFSIFGALGLSFYSIMTRQLSHKVSTQSMQFYSGMVGTACLLYLGLSEWQPPVGTMQWLLLIAIGFFGWMGHNFLTNAYRYAPPHIVMPFAYFQIIFLSINDYLIFDNIPSIDTILGAFLIIISGIFILYREHENGKQKTVIDLGQ